MAKAAKKQSAAMVPLSSDDEQPSSSGKGAPSRVMYIGRVPHGFYEDQLRGYFEQFGVISRVRLSRCKKSGKSKHYGFLEFATPEVAQIVADAMDGYMMLGQKLQCRVLNREEVHQDLWKGANRVFKRIPWAKVEAKRHNKERTPAEEALRLKRALSRDKKRLQRLRTLGIEYNYAPLGAQQQPQQLDAPPAAALRIAAAAGGKQGKKRAAVSELAAEVPVKAAASVVALKQSKRAKAAAPAVVPTEAAVPGTAVKTAAPAAAASSKPRASSRAADAGAPGATGAAAVKDSKPKKAKVDPDAALLKKVGEVTKSAAGDAATQQKAKRQLQSAEALLKSGGPRVKKVKRKAVA